MQIKLHVSVSLSDAVLRCNLLCCYSEISYCQYECNIALFTLIVTFPRAKKQKNLEKRGESISSLLINAIFSCVGK